MENIEEKAVQPGSGDLQENVANTPEGVNAEQSAAEADAGAEPAPEPEPEPIPPMTLEVVISKDHITAYVRVKDLLAGQTISVQEVLDFLQQNRVVYGLSMDDITDFCENRRFFTDMTAARGIPPMAEKDGILEFLFRTEQSINLTEKEDGTINFRDLGLVQNVTRGQLLCRLTPPCGGVDGVGVFGSAVPFPKGKTPPFPGGEHTIVSEDGLALLADVDGCVEMKGARVVVSDVYIVPENVDASVGNIKFHGTVRVNGDVREGYKIDAGGDVIVRGMVEGAYITAGGSISIGEGINGTGRGSLKAGMDVASKFIENATVIAEKGDIKADAAINSRLTAGKSVILRGLKGTLMGGSCKAGKMIHANYIGTERFVATQVSIENPELSAMLVSEDTTELDAITNKLMETNAQIEKMQASIAALTIDLGEDPAKGRLLMKHLIQEKGRLTQEAVALNKEAEVKRSSGARFRDYKVVGTKCIYPGVRISIASHSMLIDNIYNNVKFFTEPDGISSAPLTPADRI